MIVSIKQVKGCVELLNNRKHLFCIKLIFCTLHNAYYLAYLFYTLIIHGITLDYVIFQYTVRPFAKLNTTLWLYTVSNGNYHVKAVVFDISRNFTITLGLNCRKFCDSCRISNKFLFQGVADVLADGFDVTVKQLRKLCSVQPHCFTVGIHTELYSVVCGLI